MTTKVSDLAGEIKRKVMVLLKMFKIVHEYSKNKVNIQEERKKYGASRGYLTAIVLEDAGNLVVYTWVDDNGMNFRLKPPENKTHPDVVVYTTVDTVLNAFDGRIKVLDQRTGKEKYVPYTFMDAVNLGHVRAEGNDLTNILAMSARVWDDHIQPVRKEVRKVRGKVQ